MPTVILRRLRGVLISTVLWTIPWAVLGLAIGLWLTFGQSEFVVTATLAIPGGLPAVTALAGAIAGALNGLVFSLLVAVGERRGSVERIRPWRFALWGSLATFAVGALMSGELLLGAAFALGGAAMSAGVLSLARRGSLGGEEPPPELPP